MATRTLLDLGAGAAFALLGCAGSEGAEPDLRQLSFAEEPLLQMNSEGGRFEVELRSLPGESPVRGDNRLELRVVDAESGEGAEQLGIDMVPFMPAMGHASAVLPSVTELGEGGYELYPVRLSMPGRWELRTTFVDADADTITPVFDVR